MSGKGTLKRRQADAIRAYRMAQEKIPHRQIAEALNIDVKHVKARVLLGERLATLKEGKL